MSTELSWGDVTEPFGSCRYSLNIRTRYACPGYTYEDEDSGLSGGSIFLILLLCGVFTYFAAGYVVMALTVNKAGGFGDVAGNIPQKSLWVALPKLVLAGCMVTKEAAVNLAGKARGGGGDGDLDAPITTDEQDE